MIENRLLFSSHFSLRQNHGGCRSSRRFPTHALWLLTRSIRQIRIVLSAKQISLGWRQQESEAWFANANRTQNPTPAIGSTHAADRGIFKSELLGRRWVTSVVGRHNRTIFNR